MSIAKAAIIFYYKKSEEDDFFKVGEDCLNYWNIQDMHDIIDIAGAEHIGPNTPAMVSSRLYSSPLWERETIRGFYTGMPGSWKAVLYKPSEKGQYFYESYKYNKELRQNSL